MSAYTHRVRVMSGRDPHEQHRVATPPLELLFDLTFVVGFGTAASEFAHALTGGHIRAGLIAFTFAIFAICWAWINFTWFASAYDTDDWVYRVTTMVQMVGVVILTLGIPPVFASIEHGGGYVDNTVLVAGYVVMRVGLVAQWLRAAAGDPARRRACLTYAISVSVVQIGWIALIFAHTSLVVTLVWCGVLILLEISVPVLAERQVGGTPWHAHHISERYADGHHRLGEGVVGTVATLSAVVQEQGWTTDASWSRSPASV